MQLKKKSSVFDIAKKNFYKKIKSQFERECSSWRITLPPNWRGWNGPLDIIEFNPSTKEGSSTVGHTGKCPDGSVWTILTKKNRNFFSLTYILFGKKKIPTLFKWQILYFISEYGLLNIVNYWVLCSFFFFFSKKLHHFCLWPHNGTSFAFHYSKWLYDLRL